MMNDDTTKIASSILQKLKSMNGDVMEAMGLILCESYDY